MARESIMSEGEERLWFNQPNVAIFFQSENPKKPGSKAFTLYDKYKFAHTVAQAKSAGASNTDLGNDFEKSFLTMAPSTSAPEAHADDAAHVPAGREKEKVKLQQPAIVRDKLSPEKKRLKSEGSGAPTPHNMSSSVFAACAANTEGDGFSELPEQGAVSITLHQFATLLDQKLEPLRTNMEGLEGKVDNLKEQMESDMFDLKVNMDDQLEAVVSDFSNEVRNMNTLISEQSNEMRVMKQQVHTLTQKPAPGKHQFADHPVEGQSDTARKIQELETQIRNMRRQGPTSRLDQYAVTAVFGGFESQTLIDARAWIEEKCHEHAQIKPTEVYTKGEFGGVCFAKFDSESSRDTVLTQFRAANVQHGACQRVWYAPDKPFEHRVKSSFLFAIRKQLLEWGFEKRCLWVDTDKFEITWSGELVAAAALQDGKFATQFGEGWHEFLDEGVLQELLTKANTSCDKFLQFAGKGKGKGKSKSWVIRPEDH